MEDFCASAFLNVQQDTPEIEPSSDWKKGLVIFVFWLALWSSIKR